MSQKLQIATYENAIKFGTLVASLCTLYFTIKSDMRDLSTQKHYEIEHLQYQITELKECCNNKHSDNEQRFAFKHEAVLPSSIEFELKHE